MLDPSLVPTRIHDHHNSSAALSPRGVSSSSCTGLRLGAHLGRQLADPAFEYEAIHLIASSMGAYVIHGIVDAYRAALSDDDGPALLDMTFIEPFLLHGLLRPRYGLLLQYTAASCRQFRPHRYHPTSR